MYNCTMERKMSHEIIEAGTDRRGTICLSDLIDLESITARMPTLEECRHHGFAANVPLIVIRCRGGEKLAPADKTMLTIDQAPPPAPEAVHRDARYVIHHILEDLGNVHGLLADFSNQIMDSPRKIAELAGELRQQRADKLYCNEPCRFAARQEQARRGRGLHSVRSDTRMRSMLHAPEPGIKRFDRIGLRDNRGNDLVQRGFAAFPTLVAADRACLLHGDRTGGLIPLR